MSAEIGRICLSREEAAAALGMSLSSFVRHVQPELRCVRRGALRLFAVSELQKWAERNSEPVM